jgi:hypothetical protein
VQLHAVVGVHVAVEGAELGAEDASSGTDCVSTNATSIPRWRAEADTSQPIHQRRRREPPTGVEHATQRVGVLERAQHVDAVEVAARGSAGDAGSAPVVSSSAS